MEEKMDYGTLVGVWPPYGERLAETKSTPSHGELFATLASATTGQLVNELRSREGVGIPAILGPLATATIEVEGPCTVLEIDD